MGLSVESQTATGELVNAAPWMKGAVTDEKAHQRPTGAFTDGCVLCLKPGWVSIGVPTPTGELLPTGAHRAQDQCLPRKS